MSEHLVSIITPAYRAASYIEATIRSAQAQDYRNWEMLVVDDCSPDTTCAIVDSLAREDVRVRLIRQPTNAGPAVARNTALARASGAFVAFLDSDDLWVPGKLSRQLAFMTAHDAAISYTSFRRISQDGARTGRLIEVPAHIDYAGLLCNTAIVTSSVIIDARKTGPLRMPIAPYDDYALWLDLLRDGHAARGLQEDLTRYRVVQNSVSRGKATSAKRVWQTYRDIEKLGWLRSAWCFGNYAVRASLKYRAF